MAEIPQATLQQYEQIFFSRLTPSFRTKIAHGFSKEARTALNTVSRAQFVPPSLKYRIENEGMSVEAVVSDPLRLLFINEDQLMGIPPITAGEISILGIREGYTVLEIGTGSGYDAALLSVAVGQTGHVYTLETDEYLIDHSREALYRQGYHNVTVVNRDGRFGYPEEAPFDAIMMGVSFRDFDPRPMVSQLRVGGRMICEVSQAQDRNGTITYNPVVLIERQDNNKAFMEVIMN